MINTYCKGKALFQKLWTLKTARYYHIRPNSRKNVSIKKGLIQELVYKNISTHRVYSISRSDTKSTGFCKCFKFSYNPSFFPYSVIVLISTGDLIVNKHIAINVTTFNKHTFLSLCLLPEGWSAYPLPFKNFTKPSCFCCFFTMGHSEKEKRKKRKNENQISANIYTSYLYDRYT